MRIGNNPMNGKLAQALPPVVAAVITHLPNLKGYHAGRLEVIQTCLTSMRDNAEADLPFYVWDNGSCPELRDWLAGEFRPEYITFAPNVGKSSARSSIVRAFPPKTVVCVSDDDMYYCPGWLEPQLNLLRHFPNVGVVSGYPVRTMFRWGNKATLAWAEKAGAKITRGNLIPPEYDQDWCKSIGRDYEYHKNYTKADVDVLIEWNGVQAYATAHHCQFIAQAGRIEFIVQWDQGALSDERLFDCAVDGFGMLRLCTTKRQALHMGNVLDGELRQKIERIERSWQTEHAIL